MVIKCCSFADMSNDITGNNKRIIMFGGGAIGTTTVPDIMGQYDLCGYIDCYIDNDNRLWGKELETVNGKYIVRSPEYLNECAADKTVILLNMSRYAEAIRQLEALPCTDKMDCYIMPMMCIHNFRSAGNEGVAKKYTQPVIPKVIHYMWLGGNPLPDSLQKCVDSWKKYCPDYEIKCWNESNYDIGKNLYMKQAYENRAFGFVPDYARLDILYNYGGIYMDTDVELKRSLDDLLYQDAFCGVEKWQVLNFGGCSGSVPHHVSIDAFRKAREKVPFINADGTFNRYGSGYIDTSAAIKNGYVINGTNQTILDMTIYTYDYFHPYDYMSGKCEMTNNTFSVHHFNGGWLTPEQRAANQNVAEQFDRIYNTARNNK